MLAQQPLPFPTSPGRRHRDLATELAAFREFGQATRRLTTTIPRVGRPDLVVPTFVNEFWTAAQRAASPLHEISFRACFKPQLPRFFVQRLTAPGGVVYDPFMGRGTTLVEAALLGRRVIGCDVNPLSRVLAGPRLAPPTLRDVTERLAGIPLDAATDQPAELLAFYHPDTLRALCALRHWLLAHEPLDPVDAWIRMVAVNRLTGHSPGFFSVYTLPPNQATSVVAQRRINEKRGQIPPRRDVRALILRKTEALLGLTATDRQALAACAPRLLCCTADSTPEIADGEVDLVVTSPPFLDVVQYATDNWLRCWFIGVDPRSVPITMARTVEAWQEAMGAVFRELHRVVRPGGHVAFEVGEVRRGEVRLEEAVIPCAMDAGFAPQLIQINDQKFTKTANCWGVDNNRHGTNTNRIVVLRR